MIVEEKIKNWLQMKREQVKNRASWTQEYFNKKLNIDPSSIPFFRLCHFSFCQLQYQEKCQQLEKRNKEKEDIHREKKKKMEAEWKAEQKYKKWLQMKSQEKLELERKEKVCLFIFCFMYYSVILCFKNDIFWTDLFF